MKRRHLVLGSSAALLPALACAQTANRPLRVGTANVQPRTAPQWQSFLKRLAELGWREGDNLVYDHVPLPDGTAWDATYREVVARRPDIVVAAGPEASLRAALAATVNSSLPVVMIAVDYDPVAAGLVPSLAKPGGHASGVYFQSVELVPKRLELLREAFPDIATLVALWDSHSLGHWAALEKAAPTFGVKVLGHEFTGRPYDYAAAVARGTPGATFLYPVASPYFFFDRDKLAAASNARRLLSMGDNGDLAAAGLLMSFGPSLTDMFGLAAGYVDRIARGAAPGDMPIEQPTRFELVLNLRTARAIGVTLPPMLRARADREIE